jgi:hypothetical protein
VSSPGSYGRRPGSGQGAWRRYGTRKTDVGDFQCAPAAGISAGDN